MGCTEKEWLGWLPNAIGEHHWKMQDQTVGVRIGEGALGLKWQVGEPRVIALARIPRNAAQQAAATQTIKKSELRPGDLVFFNTMRKAFSHVGIYVGNGKFIHSPKPGAEVRVEDMGVAYWARRFDGARRVPVETNAGTAP